MTSLDTVDDLPNVGIVGTTGLVGGMRLTLLAERDFPLKSLRLLASERSAGTRLPFRDTEIGRRYIRSAMNVSPNSLAIRLCHERAG
jgi:aspartate-semialdehyde dehydrogenase